MITRDDNELLPVIRAVVVRNHKDDTYQNALVYGEGWWLNKTGHMVTSSPLEADQYLDITYERTYEAVTELIEE